MLTKNTLVRLSLSKSFTILNYDRFRHAQTDNNLFFTISYPIKTI